MEFIVCLYNKAGYMLSSATFSDFNLASEFARSKSSWDNYSTLEIISRKLVLTFRHLELTEINSVDFIS